jgi:4,5-dihydroxyphthalate decarboxylase
MTSSTATLTLATVFNETNAACLPLRQGKVSVRGIEMQHVPVPNIIVPFRRLCRHLEFDISELAVVAYMSARRYGLPFTAVPVFPGTGSVSVADGIYYNARSGVRTARDLEGKKVGLRAYTVTPGTWQRAYLAQQGVDISKVTWVSNDEEHAEHFQIDAPANVEYRIGANLRQMLASGEIAAALSVTVPDDPDVKQLFPDTKAADIETFKRTGVYRLGHLILVNDRVLEQHPWVTRAVFDAFKESKARWLEERGQPMQPWEDPLPIGLSQTYKSIETLAQHALDQGILDRRWSVDELFPGNLD